jgi:hypothetical protein
MSGFSMKLNSGVSPEPSFLILWSDAWSGRQSATAAAEMPKKRLVKLFTLVNPGWRCWDPGIDQGPEMKKGRGNTPAFSAIRQKTNYFFFSSFLASAFFSSFLASAATALKETAANMEARTIAMNFCMVFPLSLMMRNFRSDRLCGPVPPPNAPAQGRLTNPAKFWDASF